MSIDVLFIVKKRQVPYGDTVPYGYTISSGLLNSARFVKQMLQVYGVDAHLVEVVDNNCIDREVTKYRPQVVIVEAFWVVPEKFRVLHKLHPNVKWVIRAHSELPFLSNEGVAIEWIKKYVQYPNVAVSLNSQETYNDIFNYLSTEYPQMRSHDLLDKLIYLPNYYPISDNFTTYQLGHKVVIDVGCFGAIRPMKNQLIQAFAAIEYARRKNIGLRFHINSARVEQKGSEALKNIRALFDGLSTQYQLVEHEWMEHAEFIQLVRTMDIGLQMSFSESFNIITADFVDNGVPVVTSDQISWIYPMFQADETSVDDIIRRMERALRWKRMFGWNINKTRLRQYVNTSSRIWLDYIEGQSGK